MGGGQAVGGGTAVEGVDDKENDDQHQSHTGTEQSLTSQVSLLLGYLCLLLVGVVDGGQLGGGAVLLAGDGRVEQGEDVGTHDAGRVVAACLGIGTVLGQHVELDVVERGFHAAVAQHLVQVAVVVGGLAETMGGHQIVVGIDAAEGRLRVVGLQELLVGLGGLVGLVQALQGDGTHNLDAALVLVEILYAGIGLLAVLAQQHLGAVNPVDGLGIAARIDVGHAGVDGAKNGFLKSAAGGVRLPAVGIVTAGGQETLIGLFVTAQVELATADVVEQDSVVDVGADAGGLHLGHGRHGHPQ